MGRVADWKIWVRLTASIWLVLVFAWTGMIAWESEVNRDTAIDQARDFSRSIHEMTLAGLTGMMITGTVGQREVFLDQIKQLAAIKELHVARSDAVVKLFGPDTKAGRGLDDIERQVMQSGKAYSEVKSDEKGNYLHVVTPTLASPNYLGKNCISCHQVPEGTVLGIVSMKVSLDSVVAAVDAFRLKIAAAALGISLVLLAVVYFLTRHMVTMPIEALTHGLEDIARGEGDLTRRLHVRGDDEVGRAAKVFNEVMGNFSGLVRSVSESAQRVAAEAHSLATGATSVAQSSHLQNERSVQAAGAVEQLEQSISVISQSTERVHQQSQDSLRRAEDGNRSMSQLLGDMSNVEQTVNQMADSINEFVRNTEAINKMTREVKDIAEQTNLLALNAAIEAARAGEQGRGFAVVADEVRKLAEKSAASANEIDAITATLATQSVAVKKSINEGIEHLNSSQDSLDHVASVLSAANGSVIEVGRGLDEITRETEEQRRVSRQVVENIEAIAKMAGENNQAVEQTAAAAQSLESLADSLRQTVGRFKV